MGFFFMFLYVKNSYVKTFDDKLTVQEGHHEVASLTQVSLAHTMPTLVQRSCYRLSMTYIVLQPLLIGINLMWHCKAFDVLF